MRPNVSWLYKDDKMKESEQDDFTQGKKSFSKTLTTKEELLLSDSRNRYNKKISKLTAKPNTSKSPRYNVKEV